MPFSNFLSWVFLLPALRQEFSPYCFSFLNPVSAVVMKKTVVVVKSRNTDIIHTPTIPDAKLGGVLATTGGLPGTNPLTTPVVAVVVVL